MNWLQKTAIQLNAPNVSPRIDSEENKKWNIIGLVRGHLEGTSRFSTKPVFHSLINDIIPVDMSQFFLIINEMIERGFLEAFDYNGEEAFRWAENSPKFPGNLPQ